MLVCMHACVCVCVDDLYQSQNPQTCVTFLEKKKKKELELQLTLSDLVKRRPHDDRHKAYGRAMCILPISMGI